MGPPKRKSHRNTTQTPAGFKKRGASIGNFNRLIRMNCDALGLALAQLGWKVFGFRLWVWIEGKVGSLHARLGLGILLSNAICGSSERRLCLVKDFRVPMSAILEKPGLMFVQVAAPN